MIGIGFDLSSYTLLHSEPPLDDSFTKTKVSIMNFYLFICHQFQSPIKIHFAQM